MAQVTLQLLKDAVARVDVVSTQVGENVTAIAAKFARLEQELENAIANNVPVSELRPIADQMVAAVGQLEAQAAVLAPLGHDVEDPAPVEPPPVEPPVEPVE